MKKSTIAVIIAVLLAPQLMLSSCKRSGSEVKKPDARRQDMIMRSFEESKKVVAVRVNGEAIMMFALFREMNVVGPRYLAAGAKRTPELDKKVRQEALRNVIFHELGVQEAKKRGMKAGPELIDNEIKKMKADAGSEAAYRKYLADDSLTEDELRKMLEQDALFEMIATQEVDGKIRVTDADLRERYRKERAGLRDANHRELTFEAARGVLEQKVRAEAAGKRMREWEKELRKNARIEIVDQKLKEG